MGSATLGSAGRPRNRLLIIGVGTENLGDDAVGLLVARGLREKLKTRVTILEKSDEGVGLMQEWRNADAVILIDAVHSGSRPGSTFRLDARRESLRPNFFHYTYHAFSVAEAVELARDLKQLPEQMIVHGVEGADFSVGHGISPEVAGAMSRVKEAVLRDVQTLLH